MSNTSTGGHVQAATPPPLTTIRSGKYDAAAHRRAKRSGRERGCWIFIPAEELRAAGLDPENPAPAYTTAGRPHGRNGTVLVRLYPDDTH